MIGITGYGAYIPRYRMERSVILQQVGWFNRGLSKGEKAVANHDEDAITMSWAAGRAALAGTSPDQIDGLYMASLSFPHKLRQNAVVVGEALGLPAGRRTADFTSSLLCGTSALLAALDAKAAGSVTNALVCAADARRARPGSPQEYTWGDGAAALRVGSENVLAAFLGSCTIADDFIDRRIIDTEEFERSWEERWIREKGYMKLVPRAVDGLLEKTGTDIDDYAAVCIACPNASVLKALGRRLKVAPEKLADNLVLPMGDVGSAMPAMMLTAALEKAAPGDRILLAGFGYGAEALAFEATDAIAGAGKMFSGVSAALSRKAPLEQYARYLAYKNLISLEMGIRGESISATAMSVLHLQGKAISSLEGVRCRACGTVQFPRHRVCVNPGCNQTNQMEPYGFSGRRGEVVSFTADSLAFTWDPPQLNGLVDFEGGGRIFLDITDCTIRDIAVGTQVEMSFRRKYTDTIRGHYGYFWKAAPTTGQ